MAAAKPKGVWLDTVTSEVVETPPERGVQLVAPGVDPTPDDLARIERLRAAQPPKPVEKATAPKRASRKSAPKADG